MSIRVTVRTNAFQLAQRSRERAAAVQPTLETVARDYASRMGAFSRRVLQSKVYSVPIPRRKNGKPKWVRTGALLSRELAQADGTAIVLSNQAGHAVHRRDLGTPGGRKIVSPGIQVVDWQGETRERYRSELLEARRRAARGDR